ncbi:iron dicitrate transport regulator FecR [Roseiconus nitratireducens]|uniref:Iron dicitrate transport regulator FecR n=1 Tax=Roseiconus nitratireducens TaxID=2605748 RepID=A0A5M6D8R1_9BACT|nr:LamG-like jellyroll fold domain-containing protein [Roseiconus nitratireducens]KAA5542702.1 iron dicitrate transport regulator FecR [Roseiconus nitratireducens]
MSESTDLRSLFADYASGEITAEQLQVLEAALRQDALLRRDFIEYLNVDSALGELAALPESEVVRIECEAAVAAAAESNSGEKTLDRPSRRVSARLAFMAAAAALLLAATLWIGNLTNRPIEPVATLVADVDALLLREGNAWNDHQLPVGKYELNQGLLHLRFAGGVTVYLEAPAQFEPLSGQRLLLRSGRLSANVPPEGVGFTVETPEAEVIDFGTEFSVDVSASASEVHVFEGLVRVQPRSRGDIAAANAVDLRASQAVKIEERAATPVEIELAADRFIRTFDESRRRYARTIKRLAPVAFYQMAIRDQGLTCIPPEYSGVVLTGDGNRPPHARGVFSGGSLRVLADSTGRGGRAESPPPLRTGAFTLVAFVYLESRAKNATVATDIRRDQGSFTLALNQSGFVQATVRDAEGDLRSVASESLLPLRTWCHISMTVDGDQLRLYNDGRLVAASSSAPLAGHDAKSLWFGTDPDGLHLWDGRIDEVALFDKALSDVQITDLYQAALEEIGESE